MGKYHCMVDLLFDWFGISYMTTDNFCFYLQNRVTPTGQTGGQRYSDTSPFSIPWFKNPKIGPFGMSRISKESEKRSVCSFFPPKLDTRVASPTHDAVSLSHFRCVGGWPRGTEKCVWEGGVCEEKETGRMARTPIHRQGGRVCVK
jgi:hypothetical protein